MQNMTRISSENKPPILELQSNNSTGLPVEIWKKVLDYFCCPAFHWPELCSMRLTCKFIRNITKSNHFWEIFVNKVFPTLITSQEEEGKIEEKYIQAMEKIAKNIQEKIKTIKSNAFELIQHSFVQLNYVFLDRDHPYYTQKSIFMPPPNTVDSIVPLTRDYLLCLGNAQTAFKYTVQNIKNLIEPPILEGKYEKYLGNSTLLIKEANSVEKSNTLRIIMLDLEKIKKIDKLVIPGITYTAIDYHKDYIAIAHAPIIEEIYKKQVIDIWNFNTKEKISASISLLDNQEIIEIQLGDYDCSAVIQEEKDVETETEIIKDEQIGIQLNLRALGIKSNFIKTRIDLTKIFNGQFKSFCQMKERNTVSLNSLSSLSLSFDDHPIGNDLFYTVSSFIPHRGCVIKNKKTHDQIKIGFPLDKTTGITVGGEIYYKYGKFLLICMNADFKATGTVIIWDFYE